MNLSLKYLARATCLALSIGAAHAAEPEKKAVTLAVGSVIMNYMPVGLADATGAFEKQGLNVTVENFKAGGSKALQALVGGSVDVVVGAYDHTIQMQSKGKSIECVVQLNTLPGNSLAVRADLGDKVKTGADLKGLKIGITTPGSSADMAVRYYLQRNGLKPTDAEIIAVGSGTPGMVALEQGNVDALIYWDPVATILNQKKAVKVLFDARTPEGNTQAFGGPASPFACLYATKEFVDANPETVQRLVDAFISTLRYIHENPAAEIVDALPDNWKLPNQRDLNIAIMEASKPMFSQDGKTIPDSVKINYGIVSAYSDEVKNAKIDLEKTYTNVFAEEAAKRLK
ncbi:myristoyl transferase [Ochrobactrum sp. POC9]|uniref:ABC transporter substrate-binding protein n=1 Tax=Ochrobactrum sp. POC9 TaxID=2203419 RepID=UPI000D70880B|nr:ABC transporter substrate-binding protein [Ochrobactrum sp. POC9]PWU70974.1 myristoyl transferase [Ochrobactrum sp. POC9]